MKKLPAYILALVFAFALTPVAAGQEDHPLRRRLIDALRVLEPWLLERSDHIPYREGLKSEILIFDWRSGEDRVFVLVFVHLLDEDAAETYSEASQHSCSIPKGYKVVGKDLPGVGDESRLWGGESAGGYYQLYFRKGKMVGWLDAPSIEAAKEFARRIVGELPAT